MAMKTPIQLAPKEKPTWEGERADRTTKERILCRRCSKLATHRLLVNVSDGVKIAAMDMWFCENHIGEVIQERNVVRSSELKSWRLYKGRMTKWEAAQEFLRTQESML